MRKRNLDGPERYADEARDLAITIDDQLQRRRLHAAHRQHAGIAGLAPQQCEQAAQVHSDQPVSARSGECREIQRQRLGGRLERTQRFADRRIVERRQPQALNRPVVAAQVDDLAGDHLALAVGVGRYHQLARLGDELLHDLELRCGRRLGLDTPTLRKNGQLLDGPALVLLAVAFGWNRLHQMTDAPGHDDAGAAVAAVAALAGAQHTGDVLALGRLLAQEHAHEASWVCVMVIEWPSAFPADVCAAANK
ncbi:hypothetical protein D9M68_582580 [compost metagenome]